MPVTSEQFRFGAVTAAISAIIAILSSVVALYSQVSIAIGGVVAAQIQRDFAPVGTVVSSVLPPPDFAKATGEQEGAALTVRKWILADGRSVNGTAFAILTNDKPVPNLKGMFLRGINPDTGRVPGSVEEYATALPMRSKFTGETNVVADHKHSGGVSFGGDQYEAGGNDYRAVGTTETGFAGAHQHTVEINGGGDAETRPKNVAVYFYVKIN
ncbi:hypothetical protein FHT79_002739 [Rhizobium sp. BK212]|uniref:hypothetical protein n=1 Tax=Rhizobium sp. BK212 TaxID=2587074 RepID=UPI00160A685E|nr:hypothetical protein [Rhizobium sp. BK212]MBB4215570.1 hypothetical protein [Rhizobium sp. BK212]